MRNVFLTGLLAGIAGVLVFAWAAPFLQQDRIRAETGVQTNGGRLEVFQIRGGSDALLQVPGGNGSAQIIPADAVWYPELAPFRGNASLYRLRNQSGSVIGIASRIRAMRDDNDVEWVLHIPARGTMALTGVGVELVEIGELRAGTEEFADLAGEWQAEIDPAGGWKITTNVRAVVAGEDSGEAVEGEEQQESQT